MKKVSAHTLRTLALLYPKHVEVFQTADGLIHLTSVDAEAQAKHLTNKQVKTIPLPKK